MITTKLNFKMSISTLIQHAGRGRKIVVLPLILLLVFISYCISYFRSPKTESGEASSDSNDGVKVPAARMGHVTSGVYPTNFAQKLKECGEASSDSNDGVKELLW